jgi:putative acetyltransferase
VIVRVAAPADIPAMARIATDSYRATFATILDPDALAARDPAFFAGIFATSLPTMRVAVAEEGVVAFTKVTEQHLDMLFVAPDLQGQGAGSALLAAVEAEGVRTLECFRDNHAARRFYERHGWRLTRAYAREFIGRERAFVFYEK